MFDPFSLALVAAALAGTAWANRRGGLVPAGPAKQAAAAARPGRAAAAAQLAEGAAAAAAATGIPWLLQIGTAQGLLESGWGRATPGNNWFGIKGTGPAGSVTVKTREEFKPGEISHIRAAFRAYHNAGESVQDWARFLQGPRYRPALAMRNPAAAALWIWAQGYATAGRYVQALSATSRAAATTLGRPELAFTLSPAQATLAEQLRARPAGMARRSAATELLAAGKWPMN